MSPAVMANRLETLRAPAVIHLGNDLLSATTPRETLFTPQPFENDPPLLVGGEPS